VYGGKYSFTPRIAFAFWLQAMILVAVPFLAHMGDPNGANQPGLAYWSVFAILFIFGWISGVA
jgi:hypothetical protein